MFERQLSVNRDVKEQETYIYMGKGDSPRYGWLAIYFSVADRVARLACL